MDDYREIPLTMNQAAIVDPEDYNRLMQIGKWHAHKAGRQNSRRYYAATRPNGRTNLLLMHRVILGLTRYAHCDHINHNTLDNRKKNLRPATPMQNNWNRRKSWMNIYKGVSFNKEGIWMAKIKVKGEEISLGTFDNPVEAASAYADGARKYFGEFACYDLPDKRLAERFKPTPISLTIGRQIAAARALLSVSSEELADRLGITKQAINWIENRGGIGCSPERLATICEALGITTSQLFDIGRNWSQYSVAARNRLSRMGGNAGRSRSGQIGEAGRGGAV